MKKLYRRRILAAAGGVLALTLIPSVEGGAAVKFQPVLPGIVTCNQSQGVWSGSINFAPPIRNGGTATTETMTVKATLGNTASPCVTTAGIAVNGAIKGKLIFTGAGANKCSKVFNGLSRVPTSASKFKLTWTTPPGAPTPWKQPPAFSVVGAPSMTSLNVTGGKVTGSFSPYATPNASLSDSSWAGAVPLGCGSSAGLASLPLGTSAGTW
jgi:hypothetical protein